MNEPGKYEKSLKAPPIWTPAPVSRKLASLYQTMGDDDKALLLYERAARIFEKTLGLEHPDTINVLVKLGSGHLPKNNTEKAEEFFKLAKSKEALVELALIRGRPERPGSCWTA